MKILIGVPTHKRPELLRECLESIAGQNDVRADVQIFVADNDPTGRAGFGLAQILVPEFRFPMSSTVVDEPGISAVRNAILGEAKRRDVDFVAWIDDDECAEPNWLSNLLQAQSRTGADVVGGPVEYIFPSPPSHSIVNSRMFWSTPRSSGICAPLDASNNFLISTAALAEKNWPMFDADFGLTGGEDTEWFTRLNRCGFNFAWASNAWVREKVAPERLNARWIRRRAYRCGNADTRASIKHRDWSKFGSSLAKASAVLALAPLMAPILMLPDWRLWLAVKWWRATGRFAAAFGNYYEEYGGRHSGHAGQHAINGRR